MFRNVVAALNEALDITMHLKPLTQHFEVSKHIRKELICLKPSNIDS
jgi:hypothetical protein